jgi:hypothetical protein
MHVLTDMFRFSIAPTPAREAAVGGVAVAVAALLPIALGAALTAQIAVPAIVTLVYGARFGIALRRRQGRRDSAR